MLRLGQFKQFVITEIGPYLAAFLHGDFQLPLAAQTGNGGLFHCFSDHRDQTIQGMFSGHRSFPGIERTMTMLELGATKDHARHGLPALQFLLAALADLAPGVSSIDIVAVPDNHLKPGTSRRRTG